jgi:hypothetical protein
VNPLRVKYWEIIADNLSKNGWSWGCVSAGSQPWTMEYVARPLCMESKRGRIRRVKYCLTALAILAALSASLALADDFKTLNGKEYKNATVTHVEADRIIVRTAGGISKIYFVELPKDVADKWLAPIRAAEQAAKENRIKEQQPPKRNVLPQSENTRKRKTRLTLS